MGGGPGERPGRDRDDSQPPPLPSLTRLGPPGGAGGRGLRALVALVVLGIGVAALKPWSWGAAPPGAGSPGVTAPPRPAPAVVPAASPGDWTALDGPAACLSERSWLAVVDYVDGGVPARSWTEIRPIRVTGPADPTIARTHVYADTVERLGFCAPVAAAGDRGPGVGGEAGGTAVPPERAFRVRLWRVEPGGDGPAARELPLIVSSGGTIAEGGALYAAPAGARGDEPDAPGGAGPAAADSWPAARYVFRVLLAGAGPDGGDAAWFAIDVRGPWTGPEGVPGSPAPSATPVPPTSPGTSPAPGA